MARLAASRFQFRVTPPGWIYLLLTTAFGAQSIQSGNNLVFLIFTLMAGFAISLPAGTLIMTLGLAVSRKLPKAACAGETFHYQLEIRNTRRFGAVDCLRITDRHSGPGPTTAQNLPRLNAGQTTVAPATIEAPTRGWLSFEGIEVRAELPFGLFEVRRLIAKPQKLPVYPEVWTFQKHPPSLGLDSIGADPMAGSNSDGMDFLGLREFQPGDHPRSVHWRALGRMPDAMLVRLFETQRDHKVTLFLDSFFPVAQESACRPAFEDNICLALALIDAFLACRLEVVFAGYAGAARSFRVAADSPVLDEIRLWLATVEPERERSPQALLETIRIAPGTRAFYLGLPRSSPAVPPHCSRLAAEQLKPFLKKKSPLKAPAAVQPKPRP
jgi:uncharacterized protein (DUF58 family)